MAYRHEKASNRLKAKANLKRLLPEAIKDMENGRGRTFRDAGLDEDVFAHMSEDRISGIHIYEEPCCGWHADISFDGMPEGLPWITGTVEAQAMPTRRGAEKMAVIMLGNLLCELRAKPKSGLDTAAIVPFQLGMAVLDVPASSVDAALWEFTQKRSGEDASVEDFAKAKLGQLGQWLENPDDVTTEGLRSVDESRLEAVRSAGAAAIAAGIHFWPPDASQPAGATMH